MSRFKWHILLFALLWIANIAESKLGANCTNSRSCAQSITLAEKEMCVDGICRCNPDYEVLYTSDLTPICNDFILNAHMFSKSCEQKTCEEDENCFERPSPYFSSITKQIVCMCKPGFLRIRSVCREVSHQKVLESCYIPENGTVKSCDLNENSLCKDTKCVCFDSFFANVTSGKCEPKTDYMKAYNLTEYRVKPYEYCKSNSDCITGLKCINFQCNCPVPCKYNETAEICDCGIIEKLPPADITGPAILGTLIGMCIVAFWYHTIKKMIERHAKKKNTSHNEVPATGETQSAHALQPVSPRNEISGNATPHERTYPLDNPEKQSLLPAETKSEGNAYVPVPPPQASLYGFDTPQVASGLPSTSPGAPPPYSLLPSASECPPPYSLNPQEGTFSAPIHDSSIPTYSPYPYNAATSDQGAVGLANPTGSGGPAAPVLNPSTALPYPVSPGISGSMSTGPSVPSAPSYALGSYSASAPKQE